MKVYVVSHGSYSSESIRAVFSSEEKAKAYVAVYTDAERNEFNEYDFELDDPDGDWAKNQGLHPYSVRMMRDNAHPYRLDNDPTSEDIRAYNGRDRNDVYTECWARDEEHAIKIAADRRAEFLSRVTP